jgi:hypothetical protein
MILMKTGMHYEPAAIYLVCVLYGPSRPVCPTNIRRSHRADEGQLWVESGPCRPASIANRVNGGGNIDTVTFQ